LIKRKSTRSTNQGEKAVKKKKKQEKNKQENKSFSNENKAMSTLIRW